MSKEITMDKELEVKLISQEIVKPSSPTPPHLKTFNLSFLDQIFPAYYTPFIFFYNPKPKPNNVTTKTLEEISVHKLKSSLSQTLSQFYPLAGRFKDESTLICNDEGVPFLETRANCELWAFLTSPVTSKRAGLGKLVPPRELLPTGAQSISKAVQVAFQVNVFQCGGVVVGCYVFHKMLDVISIAIFLKHWARNAGGPNKELGLDLISPDFNGPITVFPPCPEFVGIHVPTYATPDAPKVNFVGKVFVFSNAALSNLKAQATSEHVPNPTRFEALTGFIWTHILAAEGLDDPTGARLSFPVNVRGRIKDPPIPKGSIGNLGVQVVVKAEKPGGLSDRVAEIHEGVVESTSEILREYKKGVDAIVAHHKVLANEVFRPIYDPKLCILSSSCRAGLDEVDFGLGKPEWIIPTDGKFIPGGGVLNYIVLCDYTHPSGDASAHGIAASMYLPENVIQTLDSNPDFLAYTSPNLPQWP